MTDFSIPWMDVFTILAALFLVVVVIVFWLLNFINLPGNWMLIGAVILYAIFVPDEKRLAIGLPVVILLIVLGALGELIEFVAGALGVTRAGGSRRGAVLALIGSLMGGVIGLIVGVPIPIPVVGSVISALVFAGIGALVGAMMGELMAGRNFEESFRTGRAAFLGRILGMLGKIGVGAVMVALVVCSTLFKAV